MSSSRIPSPARSLGVKSTPRRYKQKRRSSVCSPARMHNSVRLTELIPEPFVVSPLPKRRSVLTDDTCIDMPKRQSWWKKLDENSRDVIELLEHKDVPESNNIEENFDVEILSQEKQNYTMDLPESSDGESINSIVIPQRKLFTQKENHPPKKFPLIINNREELAKLQKSHVDHVNEIDIRPKSLFNQAKKPKTKPIFPAALLNVSGNKSIANKTKELPAVEPRGQVRNLFGNKPGTKRKNMFADFIVSESEDEIPEIQTKVFGFQKKDEPKRRISNVPRGLQHSPTASIVDIDMDDWKHLPSSTMVENHIEELTATPAKRTRLSKLIETKKVDSVDTNKNDEKEMNTSNKQGTDKINSATKQLNKTLDMSRKDANPNIRRRTYTVEECKADTPNEILENENINTEKRDDKQMDKSTNDFMDKQQILEQNQNEIDAEEDFTLEYENDEENFEHKKSSEEIIDDLPKEVLEGNKNKKAQYNTTSKQIFQETNINDGDIVDKRNSRNINKSQNNSNITPSKSLNKNTKKSLNNSLNNKNRTSILDDEENKNINNVHEQESTHHNQSIKKISMNKTEKYKKSQSFKRDSNKIDKDVIDHGNNDQNQSSYKNEKKTILNENSLSEYGNQIAEKMVLDMEVVELQNHEAKESDRTDNEVTKNESSREISKAQNSDEEVNNNDDNDNEESPSTSPNNESEAIQNKLSGDESEERDEESEQDSENEESHNKVVEESSESDEEINEKSHKEMSNGSEKSDEELDNQDNSDIEDNNERNEEYHESHTSNIGIQNDSSTKTKQSSLTSANQRNNETAIDPPEAILFEKTKNLIESFTLEEPNSPRKSKSMVKHNLKPSLAPVRESTRFSDNTENSSANSVWDSHRTTRKTLRKTFGKDFSPRKSLRTLVMEKSAKRQTFNPDLQRMSKHPQANPTELPGYDKDKPLEQLEDDHATIEEPMEKSDNDVNEPPEYAEEETNDKNHAETEETEEESDHSVNEPPEHLEEVDKNHTEIEETEEESGDDVNEASEYSEEDTVEKNHAETEEIEEESDHDVNEPAEYSEEDTENKNQAEIEETEEESDNDANEPVEHSENDTVENHHTEVEETIEESNHELSRKMRQTTLEMFLQKIKKQGLEREKKIKEDVMNSLKVTGNTNPFKVPFIPVRRTVKPVQRKAKPKVIKTTTLDVLPEEILEDMKYKPPKRFQPSNASWATKRLYKFLETKLEPKYDYMARVRAEKFVDTLYTFTKQIRRHELAPEHSVHELKREMARLNIVDTHYEFYNFFYEFMPREIRVKVNPDVVNRIQMPKDVFANIIR